MLIFFVLYISVIRTCVVPLQHAVFSHNVYALLCSGSAFHVLCKADKKVDLNLHNQQDVSSMFIL